ncbi:hypothetical protein FACS1894120_6960 [Clostridia bacterium]|nr:hypothetical protein FACS1894120_6960 [Clostridia bacterium]
MGANREYKDTVFTSLFRTPKQIVNLYNTLSGSNYSSDTPVKDVTLENVLYYGKHNDLAFVIDDKVVILIEQQSTLNENMPVRILIYIAKVYEKLLENEDVYKSKQIPLPRPDVVVLYNGTDEVTEDRRTLKLSSAFEYTENALGKVEIGAKFFVTDDDGGYNDAVWNYNVKDTTTDYSKTSDSGSTLYNSNKGIKIYSSDFDSSSTGLTSAQRKDIANAGQFDLTVKLTSTAPSDDFIVFSSNLNAKSIYQDLNHGTSSVTFANINPSYIFDSNGYLNYGIRIEDFVFEYLSIKCGSSETPGFDTITLDYRDTRADIGVATTSINPTPATPEFPAIPEPLKTTDTPETDPPDNEIKNATISLSASYVYIGVGETKEIKVNRGQR